MGDGDKGSIDMMRRIQSSIGTSSSVQNQTTSQMINQLNIPQLNTSQLHSQRRQFSPNLGCEGSRRVGIPPSHPQMPPISPYSHTPVSRTSNQQMGLQNFTPGSAPSHTRSLSQPSFFCLDSLPPLSPSPYRDASPMSPSQTVSADVSIEERDANSHSLLLPPSPFTGGNSLRVGESLPPRKAHRRSNSDIPFGFSTSIQSSPPLIPLRGPSALEWSASVGDNLGSKPIQLVKRESCWDKGSESNTEGTGDRKSEGEVADDLFSTYMNLDKLVTLNSSETDDKQGNENHKDSDSRASGSRTNCDSSDNEGTGSMNQSGNSMQRPGISSTAEKREGVKRNAGGDVAPTTRHYRSISMDSFMGKMNFGDESPKFPPSPGSLSGQLSPSNSIDENSNTFSSEFDSGEFSGAELKKIMANDKLAEIALSDPKRAKRILANRQSAARSKERKMRYISELERKVQTLQTEATTLSAQLTLLQRDSAGLTNQNNELKIRLQSMEQQAQLRDALNETLTAEVQRLKVATADLSGESAKFQQLSFNSQMYRLHHHHHQHPQQPNQLNLHQLQQQTQQLQLQQNGSTNSKHESTR